ncbi:MAG: NAD(+)/NADH kinase, partial [Candidatus Dormibacteraceae bacterium]
VPLNPFALTVRPIVFPAGQELWIELLHRDAVLAMDGGQLCPLRAGERVHIQTAAHPLKLVRLTERDHFYISLREKLGWGLPLVPTI